MEADNGEEDREEEKVSKADDEKTMEIRGKKKNNKRVDRAAGSDKA